MPFHGILLALKTEYVVSKINKTGPKNQRRFSVLSVFVYGHFIPLVSRLVSKILEHAEMQSETRDVQSFGAKSGAKLSSSKRAMNRLMDSNSLGDIAVYLMAHVAG